MMEYIKLMGGTLLYQWDTGRQISIHPPEGMTADEVHVAKCNESVARVLIPKSEGDDIVADIPDSMLQNPTGITIWLVMRCPDGSERTIGSSTKTIIPRAKPEDYVYTPDENLRYETLEKRIDELKENKISKPTIAEVGQVLIVEEVVDGKPTKWKCVDRTHWYEKGGEVILEETTISIDNDGLGSVYGDIPLVAGKTYEVIYNGVSYSCVATVGEGIMLGNFGVFTDGKDTGEPFVIAYMPEEGTGLVIPTDGTISTDVTLSIKEVATYHTLPNEYLNFIKVICSETLKGTSLVGFDGQYKKMSDKAPNLFEVLNGGVLTLIYSDSSKEEIEFTSSDIQTDENNLGTSLTISTKNNIRFVAVLFANKSIENLGLEEGTYFYKCGSDFYISELKVNGFSYAEEEIKEEYIPSSIARQYEVEKLSEDVADLKENGIGGSVSDEQIKKVVDETLTEAKESGEFDGEDGYTPQKGIDYFTEADKEELVEEVLENIPSGGGNGGLRGTPVWEMLASGSLPTGLEKETSIDTGLKYSDFDGYEKIEITIVSSTTTGANWSLVPLANTSLSYRLTFTQQRGKLILSKFVDGYWEIAVRNNQNVNIANIESAFPSAYSNSSTVHKDRILTFDKSRNVILMNSELTTSTVTWYIRGLKVG